MDISISNNEYYFKVKSVGLILQDNKILLVQMRDNGFFCVPGGHAKIHETAQEACIREIEEEVNVKVKIVKDLCVIENFFKSKDKKIHEITFYYIVSPLDNNQLHTKDFVRVDDNDGKLDFRWFALNNLENVDFRPQILKEKLIAKNFNFEYFTVNQL